MFQGTAPSPLDLSSPLKSIGNFIELVLPTRSRSAYFILSISCGSVIARDGGFHGFVSLVYRSFGKVAPCGIYSLTLV